MLGSAPRGLSFSGRNRIHTACIFLPVALSLVATPASADDRAADDAAYEALLQVAKVSSQTINAAGCLVTAEANYEIFQKHLPVFREAWLNRDYSEDFYRQRGKQVFTFTVLKRFAELMTEGIYHLKEGAPPACSFAISVSYADKFGQQQAVRATSWQFDQKQAARVIWERFDPRNFQDIAIGYALAPEIQAWMSDEPSFAPDANTTSQVQCDMSLFRANAIFVRATTFCSKNYMDSAAGLAALAGAKACVSSLPSVEPRLKSAMQELDQLVKQRGRVLACKWVEQIARQVTSQVR